MTQVDYYYSAHSAFAYLGAQALYDICARHEARVIHRPIFLSPVVEAAGGLPFAGRSQAHVDYFFGREIERWSEWRKVPVINFRPTFHDNPLDLPNGLIIAAQETGVDVNALSLAILQAHWRDDADHADPVVLANLAEGLGLDAQALLAQAMSDRIQTIHRQNTDAAIALGLFGSPTYVVNGDPFYGQDRLELVNHALGQPFQATNWHNPPVSS